MADNDSEIRLAVRQQTIKEVQESQKDDDAGHQPCVICLDDISEQASAFPCRHDQFDFLCLASWLEERSQCPLCKSPIDEVHYGFEKGDKPPFKIYRVQPNDGKQRQTQPLDHRQIQRSRRPRRLRPQPAPRAISPDAALRRRRQVYRQGAFSLHVGSNRISRFQELTPAMFARDAELVSRARNWIRRELKVFEYLDASNNGETSTSSTRANNAEFLLEYCIAILKTVNLRDSSGHAEDMLQEFLGRENARLFVHELLSWLRSPYTALEAWDRHVQYAESLDESNSPRDASSRKCRRSTSMDNARDRGAIAARHRSRMLTSSRLYDSYRPVYQ